MLENGIWLFNSEKRRPLLNDYVTGWLLENDDQLSQNEVLRLVGKVKSNAVPQYEGKTFPNKPQISDPSKSSGAFGLPEEYIKKIEAQAIKGSGKIEQP